MRLVIRWLVAALALFAAARLVPGIVVESQGAWTAYAVMALILAFVNALVRPILTFLSCPMVLLTLGLFLLIINAVSFWLAGWIAQALGVGFEVHGFTAALLGSLVVSLVSTVLLVLLPDED